jgi:hypothetical protein
VAKRAALTEARWQAIVKAAAPQVPDEHARSALRQCIKDYFGLQRDPAQLRRARDLWRGRAKKVRDLIDGHPPWTGDGLKAIEEAMFYASRQATGLDVMLRPHKGWGDPAGEWLLGRLLEIWRLHFAGNVAISSRRHRPPSGPLVRFIIAVFSHLLNQSISPHTIRDRLKRQRKRWRACRVSQSAQ